MRFEQEPCLALSERQLAELFGDPIAGEPFDGPLGKACKWRVASTRAEVQIRFMSKDPYGLSAEYAADKNGQWEYFDELPPVEGHPVVARSGTDDRPNGGCSLVVGASDEIAFELVMQLSEGNVGKKDPCEIGALAAGMAVRTMKDN